jgi:hypothetical protein
LDESQIWKNSYDEFLRALDSIYGTGLRPTSMALKVECEAISLQGNPLRLSSGPVKMKLFFGSEDDYSELYLNIERTRARVQLKEKDPYYRAPIVRALSASGLTPSL